MSRDAYAPISKAIKGLALRASLTDKNSAPSGEVLVVHGRSGCRMW